MWPGPVRRVGLAQVPAVEPRPVAGTGWASTTSMSSTPTASTRTPRSKRRWARSTPRCDRAGRSTPASRPTPPNARAEAARDPARLGTPLLIHQPSYSMLNRWIEGGLLDTLERTRRRLHRVLAAGPGHADVDATWTASPQTRGWPRQAPRRRDLLTEQNLTHIRALNETGRAARAVARAAGPGLVPARRAGDIGTASGRAASPNSRTTSPRSNQLDFTADELAEIDGYAVDGGINLWEQSSDS